MPDEVVPVEVVPGVVAPTGVMPSNAGVPVSRDADSAARAAAMALGSMIVEPSRREFFTRFAGSIDSFEPDPLTSPVDTLRNRGFPLATMPSASALAVRFCVEPKTSKRSLRASCSHRSRCCDCRLAI